MFAVVCVVLWLLGKFVKGGRSEEDRFDVADSSSNARGVRSGELEKNLTNDQEEEEEDPFKMFICYLKEVCAPNPKPGSLSVGSVILRILLKSIGMLGYGVGAFLLAPFLIQYVVIGGFLLCLFVKFITSPTMLLYIVGKLINFFAMVIFSDSKGNRTNSVKRRH